MVHFHVLHLICFKFGGVRPLSNLAPLPGTNRFVHSKISSVFVFRVLVCVCSSSVVELVYVHCDVNVVLNSVPVSIPVCFCVV